MSASFHTHINSQHFWKIKTVEKNPELNTWEKPHPNRQIAYERDEQYTFTFACLISVNSLIVRLCMSLGGCEGLGWVASLSRVLQRLWYCDLCPVFRVQDVALLSLMLCCCSLPWPLLRAAWLLLLPDPAAWEPNWGKTLLPKPGGSKLCQTLEKTWSVSVNVLAPVFSEKYNDYVFLFKIK